MSFRRPIPQQIIGAITANGQTVAAFVEEYDSAGFTMKTSALVGHTAIFEVSNDASTDPDTGNWDGVSGTWYQVLGQRSNAVTTETGPTALAATPAYAWTVPCSAWRFVRVRATAHTSGVAVWGIMPGDGPACLTPSTASFSGGLTASTATVGDVGGAVRPGAGGISTIARMVSAAGTTNATVAKAGQGRLYGILGYNAAAAIRYLKLYNKSTAPTVGTDTPALTIALAPSAPFVLDFGLPGLYFTNGIGYATTTGSADADATAVTAADIVGLNITYA